MWNLTINDYEELYIAGIPSSGELYNWVFKKYNRNYWIAMPKQSFSGNGIKLEDAIRLYETAHPVNNSIKLGSIIRAGGDGNGLNPTSYVSQPVYDDALNQRLLTMGYKEATYGGEKHVNINYGEMATLCNSGMVNIDRYVDNYHIDSLLGLCEFVRFLKCINVKTINNE